MKIAIIGTPMYYGCDNRGVETSPDKLRSMGLIEQLESKQHTVCDFGNINIPQVEENSKYSDHPKMKYVGPIYDTCKELSETVSSALKDGYFPLIIGGDHSYGIGILSGVSRVYGPETAVLWIDSHSDIHSFATSGSGNVHGVPLGASIGLNCGKLTEIFNDTPYIKGENVFIIGLRSYEPEEIEIIEKHGVNHYFMNDIRERGLEDILMEITAKLISNRASTLHISFDIDSLDPSVAPGTGILVPDGFTESEVSQIINSAFETGLVNSMDISELNPLKDKEDMTSLLALRVACHVK